MIERAYMSKKVRRLYASIPIQVEGQENLTRRDMSAGANSRLDPQDIGEKQAVVLNNVDIGTPGKRIVRPGLTEIDVVTDKDNGLAIWGFEPDGGTYVNQAVLLSGTDTVIFSSESDAGDSFTVITGTANIVDTALSTAFHAFKSGGDGHVMLYGSASKNWHEIKQDDTVTDLTNDNDDPPRSAVGAFFGGRMWVLSDNLLYWSTAYPNTYAGAFNRTTDAYNMPVGEEKFLIGIREKGLICGGKDEIRYIQPSNTPAATDEYGILVKDGCVAGRSAALVGDDIFFLAKDGVRGAFKTATDTLQYKTSLPVSHTIKDEVDSISWNYAHLASAIEFDNKYFISLPVDSSKYNNEVWVYYPATNGWMVITGWNVADFSVLQINGENRLFAIDSTTGEIYRAWYGSDDDGTDIAYEETHRKEDLNRPFEEKRGGELILRSKATGEYDIKVYGSFDESDFNLLGILTTENLTTTFTSWSFPMIFKDAKIHTKKFHLDRYGPWYQMQVKITSEDSSGGDLALLQHSIITHIDEYDSEETR